MTIGPQTAWTDAQGEEVMRLYLDGKSPTEIVRLLNRGLTRNAVISKVHRMGVTRPPEAKAISMALGSIARKGPGSKTVAAQANTFGKPRAYHPPRERVADEISVAGAVPLMKLGAHMCRWPIGDPTAPGFGFCGAAMGEREPYCDGHAKRAFQPTNPRLAKASAAHVVRLCAA